MANKLPIFASAPRITINVAGQKLAYAIGLSLNASVQLQEVRVLGDFSIKSIEPTMTLPVTGSFQIVRILNNTTRTSQTEGANFLDTSLAGTLDKNGVGKTGEFSNSVENEINDQVQKLIYNHIDPEQVLASRTFDIEMKIRGLSRKIDSAEVKEGKVIYKQLDKSDFVVDVGFFTIQDCRLVGASMNLAPGQLMTQSLEFQGLLLIHEGRNAATSKGIREGLDISNKEGVF